MIEYVDVEGIKCEVKDPSKKATVVFCQHNLRIEIDKYIGEEIMNDSRRSYASALEVNIKILPFVIGWLKKPMSEDEYRVIKGTMTIDELNNKTKKAATKTAPKSNPKK